MLPRSFNSPSVTNFENKKWEIYLLIHYCIMFRKTMTIFIFGTFLRQNNSPIMFFNGFWHTIFITVWFETKKYNGVMLYFQWGNFYITITDFFLRETAPKFDLAAPLSEKVFTLVATTSTEEKLIQLTSCIIHYFTDKNAVVILLQTLLSFQSLVFLIFSLCFLYF